MQKYLKYGYLITICTVLPLYMKDGYYKLGESKGIAYMAISVVFALLFLLSERKNLFVKKKESSYFTYAIGLFLFSNILTFVSSIDKKTGFLGIEGWRCGFFSVFLMTFFLVIFFLYREERKNNYILAAILIVPFLEAVLGILGRFGINLLNIYGESSTFLATIGNINWYAGYLSVFVPLGVGLTYVSALFSASFFVCGIYTFIGLLALLLQGSDSALLIIGGTYLLLYFVSLERRDDFRKFLCQLFILGLSMESAAVLLLAFGSRYTYDTNLPVMICSWHVGIILMALTVFLYRLTRLLEGVNLKWRGNLYLKAGAVSVIILAVIAAVCLGRDIDYNSGNGRGLIYSISVDIYKGLSPWRAMVGVGHDGFCSYAYSNSEIADSLMNVFGASTLTNAHSEVLTILIERGVLGMVSYLFLIGAFMVYFVKNKKKHTAIVCMLPVFACFLNSLVSFSLVISTPYMFILMGIGASDMCEDGK